MGGLLSNAVFGSSISPGAESREGKTKDDVMDQRRQDGVDAVQGNSWALAGKGISVIPLKRSGRPSQIKSKCLWNASLKW